ncbi:MAG: tRNA preQ1(34) S-adenosylmethionine ribosyltransferase-isomerase QueA [Chitinivibrionales bacterium]|nr:tRNA preQ1(34) S-adenosylmethionine ribosyltransferase-isomerase QueA [Chitinivibrionales bacterium]
MKTSDFFYELPPELIAQYPNPRRDQSRLLVVNRKVQSTGHFHFFQLPEFLQPGDRLVFNDTKVYPGRIFCRTETRVTIELLFTKKISDTQWTCMAKPGRRLTVGRHVVLIDNESVRLRVDAVQLDGERVMTLVAGPCRSIEEVMHTYGSIPLPPYIDRKAMLEDSETYQTVFARRSGAIAAPTAGLHFTDELFAALEASGIACTFVTLHVGVGTFKPVKVDDPRQHPMHQEEFFISDEAVSQIRQTKSSGGRIIAVGTTVVRLLEHCAAHGNLTAGWGKTNLMILPGFTFRVIDGLITNFHLPSSTLLMLVAAFGGQMLVKDAYRNAVEQRYRFFSYGDAMFLF